MRLARLDLVRYGKFSDYVIDFGVAPPPGAPDFHVIYGLNEAGKSTLAAAILDLFFGIEKQTGYGAPEGRASAPAWHAYAAMRISARLELADGAHELARLKRDKASLVGADNRPADEARLRAELGGLTREAFRAMFSLDDESLEDGGEAILASRGDLGQLLFAATAGLAEISAALGKIRETAEGFYSPRKRSGGLAEYKKALEQLKTERDRADTLAGAYAQLVERRDAARAAYDRAVTALSASRSRAAALNRRLAALPHLAALDDAEARLAPLADLPTSPPDWRDKLAELQAEFIRLAARMEDADEAARRQEAALAGLASDPAGLDAARRVEGWKGLRSRFDAARDIPVRQGELAAKREAVADVLSRLGRAGEADPRALLLGADVTGPLGDLVAARSGVVSALATALEGLEEAERAEAGARDTLQAAGGAGDPAGLALLAKRLDEARRDDGARAARAAAAEIARLERAWGEALRGLLPWSGDATALARLEPPSEVEVAALRRRLTEARALKDRRAEAQAAKAAEIARLEAESVAAARAAAGLDDASAADLRASREAAWAAHRARLDAAGADAFEAAMRRDDAIGAARLAAARDLAALRERAIALAGLRAEATAAAQAAAAADKAVVTVEAEIAALSPMVVAAGRDALSFLDAWRARRDEALRGAEALRLARDGLAAAEDTGRRMTTALAAALAAVGAAPAAASPLEALIVEAEAAVARASDARHLSATLEGREAELARARGRLRAAREADERWRADWRRGCAACWLGEGDPEPALGAVRERLAALDDLRLALRDCDDLQHRIAAMEHDRERFAQEVAAVAAGLAMAPGEGDAGDWAERIERRVAAAVAEARKRDELDQALAQARGRRASLARASAANAELAATMTAFFGVASLADVAAKLDACKARDEARAAAETSRRAILATNLAASIETARELLAGADRAALDGEIAALTTREEDEVKAHAEAHAAHREAERALEAVGGDDAVARLEERRRTILEEIRDGALRYLRLRAGVAAADEALRIFRDKHRGAMMERAAEAFRLISRGAYRGLTTAPDGADETLIALGADGGSKAAEQLSKGARFQLYLALRVAGYHELAKARAPAPFVADDIMETFDHFRAEEALRLFADMGRVGQVIYLTHHQHLAEIARRVCPEARLHELTG